MNIWITAFPTVVIFLLFSIFLNFKLKSQKKSITILLLLFVLLFIDQLKDEYQHLNFYFKSFIFVAMLLVLLSNKKVRTLKRNIIDAIASVAFISSSILFYILYNSLIININQLFIFNYFWLFSLSFYVLFSVITFFYYQEGVRISVKERLLVLTSLIMFIFLFIENSLLEGLKVIFNNVSFFQEINNDLKFFVSDLTYIVFFLSILGYIYSNEKSKVDVILSTESSRAKDLDILTIIQDITLKSNDIESTVDNIINITKFLINPDGIIVFLYNKERNVIEAKGVSGYAIPPYYVNDKILSDSGKLHDTIRKSEVKLNNVIISQAIKELGFLFIKANPQDKNRAMLASLRDYSTRIGSLLVGAFNIDKELGGFLYLHNRITDFSDVEVKLFKSLCSLVSVLISNIYSRELSKEKERLQNEMNIAERIQTSILPKNYEIPGYKISPFMKPADEVGGDYFDIINSKNGKFWINIGDVTGHGLTAGLIMLMLQTSASSNITSDPDITPDELVIKSNKTIFDNIRNRLLLDQYITACFLRGDQKGLFQYAGAHEDILVYRSKTKTVERIPTTGIWLGLTEDISNIIKGGSFKLEKNDVLFLFTDGVIEIMNEKGEQYDIYRLEKFLANMGEKDPDEIRDLLYIELSNFKYKQNDDITFVIVKKMA